MRDTFKESPRPWQSLVAERMLEVDEDDQWCWASGFLVSVPRQRGKSWMLRMILAWLSSQGYTCLGTTNRLRTAHEILRPLGVYSREHGGFWRKQFDQPEVHWPGTEGRVIFQSDTDALAVGWSPHAAAVDEAWDVNEVGVQQGLVPALSAAPNPILILTSTVGTTNSTLLAHYRDAALGEDSDIGIAEWSAPPGAEWTDEEVWKAATPDWDKRRLDFMRKQIKVLGEQKFRSQLLNQSVSAEMAWIPGSLWESRRAADVSHDETVEPPAAGASDDAAASSTASTDAVQPPLVTGGTVAVEITLDGSKTYAVHAVRGDDGVVSTEIADFVSWIALRTWIDKRRPQTVLAPPPFRERLTRIDRVVGSGDIAAAMPIVYQALTGGTVTHPGDPRLDEAVLAAEAKVTKAGSQTLIAQDGRSLSAVRAWLWAVSEASAIRAGRPRIRVAR